MKFSASTAPVSADILFLLFHKGEGMPANLKSALGAAAKLVEARFKAKDFEGEEGQTLTVFTDGAKWKRIVLVGRGEKGKEVPQALEYTGAKLSDLAKAAKATHAAVWMDEKDPRECAYGMVLGSYEFKRYKTPEKKLSALEKVTLIGKWQEKMMDELNLFAKVSPGLRDLVNTCAGDLDPMQIARHAEAVCKPYKMKVTVFDQKKLEKLGCNAIVGVGKGAKVGPCMIFIEYRHKSNAKEPSVAFLGKGISFDTGGLNLKPSGYIETMKLDMAGAATVLATMQALAEAKVPGYFLGVMACAENAISDRAQHPGDVAKAYNGKTIEVNNTDGEGRLVLADALAYTEKNYKPKLMIDIATLTGAVTVALGYHVTGVMGNNQKFVDDVLDAAKDSHERMWQLPLDEDFVKLCKGHFSDLQNATDGVRAGTIMGAAFLKHFVDKTPWVHLDVGGTAWADKPTPSTKYGATTAGLRTFIELAMRHAG